MSIGLDPVKIANTVAEIASKSSEPETARQLMELVNRLLTQAGLPPERLTDNSGR
jgi:hypothetical protein